jgi:hypothetical protein
MLMAIYGGSTHKRYRCSGNIKRGTCPNRMSIREETVRGGILGELRRLVTTPWGILYLRKLHAQEIGDGQRRAVAELAERRDRLVRTEHRIRNLLAHIADGAGDKSDHAKSMLNDLYAQESQERLAIASLEAEAGKPIDLPLPDEMRAQLDRLEAIITADPVRGREALRAYFKGGSIVLTPFPEEKIYEAKAELLPLLLLLSDAGAQAKPPSGVAGRRRYIPVGCGGAVLPLADVVVIDRLCPRGYGSGK